MRSVAFRPSVNARDKREPHLFSFLELLAISERIPCYDIYQPDARSGV